MHDKIILICSVVAAIGAWPLGLLMEDHAERTYAEMWRKVQEQTRTKGVAVGELAKFLGRNTISK